MGWETASQFPKRARARQQAIFELVETESSYVQELEFLVIVFYDTLKKSFSLLELKEIFSNVDDVWACSKVVLQDWLQRQNEQNYIVTQVADLVMRLAESVSPYVVYCSNQRQSSALLQTRMIKDSKFSEIVRVRFLMLVARRF